MKMKLTLGTKVFFLTFLLLLFCNFITCLLVSVFTPQTYSAYLTDSLNEKVYDFLEKAETVSLKDSGNLFEALLQNSDILSVSLSDKAGNPISIPSDENKFQQVTMVAVSEAFPESYTLQSYDLSFADKKDCTLSVYGNAEPVHQLQAAFRKLFPWLILITTLVSLLFSFFYSRLVARLQRDIENEKQLEKERLAFFSAASHELKTPVTIIRGQLEGMLLNVGVYKKREKYLARSLEIAGTLETMIQELLISSHLDAPDYRIQSGPVALAKITLNRLALAEDLLVSKRLTVHTDMDEALCVKGDASLLEKAVDNLVSNAAFYSPEDNDIFISLKSSGQGVFFRIENTGVHIPDSIQNKIFEPFYRGEQSRSRQTGGSGLGLSIVQKILKMHGSACEVQNTEKGVCFSFRLPRENFT